MATLLPIVGYLTDDKSAQHAPACRQKVGVTRFVIADDHENTRRILRGMLERQAGWEVCGEATGGQEAVEKVIEQKPDLVILDLAMPFMDGLRAAREITKALPAMPIMLYTLYNTPGLEPQAEKVGIRKVIDKADGAPKLLGAIHEVLKSLPKVPGGRAKSTAQGRD